MNQVMRGSSDDQLAHRLEERICAHSSATSTTIALPVWTPPPASPAACGEWVLRCHLRELNFEFGAEKLHDLEGFMICEDGYREIVVADDLDDPARICLYLHLLGHVALGHIDEQRGGIRYEVRVRDDLTGRAQVEEYEADRWVLRLLERRVIPKCEPKAPFREGALQAVRNIKMRPGQFRHGLHRITDFLYENVGPYRRLRLRPEVQGLLAAIYRHLQR